MSVQAGIWNLNRVAVLQPSLEAVSKGIAEFGPDGENVHYEGCIGMVYRPRYTTLQSRLESQPFKSADGSLATWDGRLDNRGELAAALSQEIQRPITDIAVAVAAFNEWGTGAFGRFRGEWAFVIWNPDAMVLTLARDYAGIRHLFYYITREKIIWSTCLASLALCGDKFTLSDEYVAGYLAFHPEPCLTPYREIHSVPPGAFVTIHDKKTAVERYWKLNPSNRTRYKTDAEYEEHYRYLFRQAVRRRLDADRPVLSELSGGLDSSSIVCMADDILQKEEAVAPRLDTFSYFDSNEPGEDDFAHFIQVEQKRGQIGFRIDLKGSGHSLPLEYSAFPATPGFGSRAEVKSGFSEFMAGHEYRVMLSGTGGDEMNGQPLDPCLLMTEMLLHLRFRQLGKSLAAWSLRLRRPWIGLLFQTALQFLPTNMRSRFAEVGRLEPWVDRAFAKKYDFPARQIERVEGVGLRRPAIRDAIETIETLRRQFTFTSPSLIEKRYPFLDQDLVEYLMSVPLDQLLRPGERRSLMKRSLAGLLPNDIATRKTKTGAARCYSVALECNWARIVALTSNPLIVRKHYVDHKEFFDALLRMRNGLVPKYFLRLLKALSLELWLQEMNSRGIIAINQTRCAQASAGTVDLSIGPGPPPGADFTKAGFRT